MKTLMMWARGSRWFHIGTLTLVAMALALPLGASASSITVSQSEDQAAFRKEFVTYLTQMQQVAATLQASPQGRAASGRLGVRPSAGLARSREAVAQMTPEQLAVLQRAFAAAPNWQAHPRILKAALSRNGFSPNGTSRTFGVGPNCDPGPGTPLGITDFYIAAGVALALEIVHEAIPDDVLTAPAQIAAAVAWGVAATAALVLEGLNAVEAECQGAKLEDFTRTQLDVKVSTRATQTSVDVITANLATLSALVNSRLDVAVSTRATQSSVDTLAITVGEQGELALRLEIEADLSESGDPVALFEVPAAQGGYLELVREIVVDTIAKMTAAGQPVGKAVRHLADGDAAVAEQDFKEAYNKYGKAYREAASKRDDDDD